MSVLMMELSSACRNLLDIVQQRLNAGGSKVVMNIDDAVAAMDIQRISGYKHMIDVLSDGLENINRELLDLIPGPVTFQKQT